MDNFMDRLFYWWEDVTGRFGSAIIAFLVITNFFSISFAVIERERSRNLQAIIEASIRQKEAEQQDNKNKLYRKKMELNRLRGMPKFMRDRGDSTVKATVNGIDLNTPYPYQPLITPSR